MEKERAPLPAVDFSEFTPASYAEWKEEATASLKGAPFDKKLLTKTYEGITLEPLYTAAHAQAFGQKSSLPGAADYLRGAEAAGYSGQPWLIAQKNDSASPEKANTQLREGLSKGVTAICFNPCCCPVINTLAELETLLKGIEINRHPFTVFCGASPLPMLGLLSAYAAKHSIKTSELTGVIGGDPLGKLAKKGANRGAIAAYYDQLATAIRWAGQNMPQVRTIFIQGSIYSEGGASAVQELSAMFAAAVAYLDALTERGLSVEQIASQISFSFSLGANFFMEIAKLRAARLLWAQIVKAYGGGQAAAKLSAHAATASFTNTVYDPYVNVLRATTEAFSAVVGGIDSLTIAPFDSAIRESDEQSRRIARNIQVMMQNEFNLISPADPAGGSWFVETLTGQLAEAAWQEIQQIEAAGGFVAALQTGSIQQAIAATLAARFKALSTRADKAVGSNMYANTLETRLTGTPSCEMPGCGCGEGKAPAAVAAIDGCICTVADAFQEGANMAQVKAALNKGESESVTAIKPHRWTEQFEALRDKTAEHAAKSGQAISVFLANMGPIPQHKARADFSAGFMEVGGFTVLRNDGFAEVATAAAAAIAAKATATVICSTDDTYPELVPPLAAAIKAQAPQMLVIVAGAPAPEFKDAYLKAGVDEFIHIKADCLSILSKIQQAGGVE